MKKFIFAIMAVAAFGCVALTSCSKDDDKNTTTTNNGGGENGSYVTNYSLGENGNTMVCRWTEVYVQGGSSISVNYMLEALFENNLCVSLVSTITFPNPTMASEYYNDIINDPDENADRFTYVQGSASVVEDLTDDFGGWTKDQIRNFFESMEQK